MDLLESAQSSIVIWDPHYSQCEPGIFSVVQTDGIRIEVLTVCEGWENKKDMDAFADKILCAIDSIVVPECHVFVNALAPRDWRRFHWTEWHDRYLIIDNSKVFLVGSSLDAQYDTRKSFGICQLAETDDINLVIDAYNAYKGSIIDVSGGARGKLLCTQAMKNRDRFIAAHYQSGFHSKIKFQLLDDIENNGKSSSCVCKENETVINELAERIVGGTLTRYELGSDYIKEKYHIEDVWLAYYLCEAAFYKAGCMATASHSEPTLEYLAEIEENMDGGFFIGYQPRKESLEALVESLDGKALEVASESRDIDRQSGALREFCEKLDEKKNEEEIVESINNYNDGSYLELSLSVQALAYLLARREYWDAYYRLIEVLNYYPLQGSLIKSLRNINDLTTVISIAETHNGRKSVHYLLREHCFGMLLEENVVLKNNCDDETLLASTRDYIKGLLNLYENDKPRIVESLIVVWLKIFGKEELTSWLSGKKTKAEHKHPKFAQPELDLVEMMSQSYTLDESDIKEFILDDKDFQTLITLASHTEDKDACKKIIQALRKNIFAERSYPPTTINGIWFEQARTIYQCLNKSGENGVIILKEERKPFEGYMVDLKASMQRVRQEAYWLAVLLLSLENGNDECLLKTYIEVLFKDTRYSLESFSDDVFAPYYVAELLVTQVLKGQKDAYEKKLIEEIPYLVFVIRVLTANEGRMSDEIKQILSRRLKADWAVERKLMSQRKVKNLVFYDEYVKNLLNSNKERVKDEKQIQ